MCPSTELPDSDFESYLTAFSIFLGTGRALIIQQTQNQLTYKAIEHAQMHVLREGVSLTESYFQA